MESRTLAAEGGPSSADSVPILADSLPCRMYHHSQSKAHERGQGRTSGWTLYVPMPTWERILDLLMLAIYGGRERTQREYASLLARAGFSLQRAIDTSAGVWVFRGAAKVTATTASLGLALTAPQWPREIWEAASLGQ